MFCAQTVPMVRAGQNPWGCPGLRCRGGGDVQMGTRGSTGKLFSDSELLSVGLEGTVLCMGDETHSASGDKGLSIKAKVVAEHRTVLAGLVLLAPVL